MNEEEDSNQEIHSNNNKKNCRSIHWRRHIMLQPFLAQSMQ